MNQTGWCGKSGAQKNLHLCRAAAFENPLFSEGASRPDYGSHYGVGLHAPDGCKCLAPCGYSIGSSKVPSVTNTAEVVGSRLRLPTRTLPRRRAVRKGRIRMFLVIPT